MKSLRIRIKVSLGVIFPSAPNWFFSIHGFDFPFTVLFFPFMFFFQSHFLLWPYSNSSFFLHPMWNFNSWVRKKYPWWGINSSFPLGKQVFSAINWPFCCTWPHWNEVFFEDFDISREFLITSLKKFTRNIKILSKPLIPMGDPYRPRPVNERGRSR